MIKTKRNSKRNSKRNNKRNNKINSKRNIKNKNKTVRKYKKLIGGSGAPVVVNPYRFLTTIGSVLGFPGDTRLSLKTPSGIALSSSTNLIYIADSGNHLINVFDCITGEHYSQLGSEGSGDYKFINPLAVAVSSVLKKYDIIYVADERNHRVQVFLVKFTYESEPPPKYSHISKPWAKGLQGILTNISIILVE